MMLFSARAFTVKLILAMNHYMISACSNEAQTVLSEAQTVLMKS